MRRSVLFLLLLAGLCFGTEYMAGAQTYNLSWYTIAGGGGSSTGTNASNVVYSLSGTIGQSDAGQMSGGSYSLTGGFWGVIAAVQTPGSPQLTIKVVDNSHVALLWSASFSGFVPQQNSALSTTNWTAVNTNTFPIVVTNGSNSVTLPVSGNQYFRLLNP